MLGHIGLKRAVDEARQLRAVLDARVVAKLKFGHRAQREALC